jgi:uncharacterized membrane protein
VPLFRTASLCLLLVCLVVVWESRSFILSNGELMLEPCSALFTLKMEVICSSQTSVDFQWTTWCYIPKDIALNKFGHLYEVQFHTSYCLWFVISRRNLGKGKAISVTGHEGP